MTTTVTIKNHGPKAVVLATDNERIDLGEGSVTEVTLYTGRSFTLLEAPDSIEPLPEPLPVFASTEPDVPVELRSNGGFVLGGYLYDPVTQVSVPASLDFLDANVSVLELVVTEADAAADAAGTVRGLPTYKYRTPPEPILSVTGEAKAISSTAAVADTGTPEVDFSPPEDAGLNIVRAVDLTDSEPVVSHVDTPARIEQEVSTPEIGYTDGGPNPSFSGGNE